MNDLILIGGGGHCKSCIDVIEQEHKFKIIGILDTKEKLGNQVLDYEIIGTDDDIKKYIDLGCYFLVTIGQIKSPDLRVSIYKKLKQLNAKIAKIISPNAYVSKYAMVGSGSIIMNGTIINAGAKIGENCIINSKALIEHDSIINNNCHISIGAVVAGGVEIGEQSFVGANSTIAQGVKISAKSFIKAGSLVK